MACVLCRKAAHPSGRLKFGSFKHSKPTSLSTCRCGVRGFLLRSPWVGEHICSSNQQGLRDPHLHKLPSQPRASHGTAPHCCPVSVLLHAVQYGRWVNRRRLSRSGATPRRRLHPYVTAAPTPSSLGSIYRWHQRRKCTPPLCDGPCRAEWPALPASRGGQCGIEGAARGWGRAWGATPAARVGDKGPVAYEKQMRSWGRTQRVIGGSGSAGVGGTHPGSRKIWGGGPRWGRPAPRARRLAPTAPVWHRRARARQRRRRLGPRRRRPPAPRLLVNASTGKDRYRHSKALPRVWAAAPRQAGLGREAIPGARQG